MPLTKETTCMINAEKIALMKKNAILINTARGKVIDTQALADALNKGKIAGASIDVFDTEPPIKAENPLLTEKMLCYLHILDLIRKKLCRKELL